ncbi:Txe/YoeB family addiction module toxin [Frateuria defendens]|uniref:Txe/YoeB family addiction module toxin n=1 Tax=Frateuria defendens TaxID=2219559 RepID=UPI00066FDB96|nr:Txe/YoeB family addiction module toxin [Frateuria defendens]
MILQFSDNAWEDYLYWQQADKKLLKRINDLIKAIQRDPFQGIGKPEPLRHALVGYWSRRINDEHRIVYKAEGDILMIAQLRLHY